MRAAAMLAALRIAMQAKVRNNQPSYLSPYIKRQRLSRCPLVEFSVSRFLEPLHQLDIPEPSKVVVETDGEIVGITLVKAIRLRRICA
jgi:hypothetical protein